MLLKMIERYLQFMCKQCTKKLCEWEKKTKITLYIIIEIFITLLRYVIINPC